VHLPPVFEFPKSARLLRAQEYTSVLRSPHANLSAGPLRIRARKNRMRSARLGLVVTKKGNPLAVRRNRLKRIVREQFRAQRDTLPAVDVVVQIFGQIDDLRLARPLQQLLCQISDQLGENQPAAPGAVPRNDGKQ